MQRPIQEARRSYPLYGGVSSSRRRSGRGDAHHRRVYRRRLRSSPRPVPALRVQTTRSAGRTEHARSAAVAALAKHDILLDRGLGAAGIAVASATVEGTRDIPFTIIKTASPALGPLGQGEPVSAHSERVPLRIRPHRDSGGVERAVRTLCGARTGGLVDGARVCQFPSCQTHAGGRHPRSTCPAAVHRVRRGPRCRQSSFIMTLRRPIRAR
jgi:hypothetical protein